MVVKVEGTKPWNQAHDAGGLTANKLETLKEEADKYRKGEGKGGSTVAKGVLLRRHQSLRRRAGF
jgi:hypothetical protein